MTLPYERYDAVLRTRRFLMDIVDPKKTPRIPASIREQAYYCLHHYPNKFNMDVAATQSPSVFETKDVIDPLSLLVIEYEEKK